MTKPLSTLVIGAGDRGNKVLDRGRGYLSPKAIAESNPQKRKEYVESIFP